MSDLQEAKELIVRFLANDPNVAGDAQKWLRELNQNLAAKRYVFSEKSTNLKRMYLRNDELFVVFHRGGAYAYRYPDGDDCLTYKFPDGSTQTQTMRDIFDLLVEEDKTNNPSSLFHHLIKRQDNKLKQPQYYQVSQ